MTVADKALRSPGNFKVVRTLTGAVAPDTTDYSDAIYRDLEAFSGEGCDTAWVTWDATGGALTDTITVELLVYNSTAAKWIALGAAQSVRMKQAIPFTVAGASRIFARIHAKTSTATDPIISVAQGLPLYVV